MVALPQRLQPVRGALAGAQSRPAHRHLRSHTECSRCVSTEVGAWPPRGRFARQGVRRNPAATAPTKSCLRPPGDSWRRPIDASSTPPSPGQHWCAVGQPRSIHDAHQHRPHDADVRFRNDSMITAADLAGEGRGTPTVVPTHRLQSVCDRESWCVTWPRGPLCAVSAAGPRALSRTPCRRTPGCRLALPLDGVRRPTGSAPAELECVGRLRLPGGDDRCEKHATVAGTAAVCC